MDSDSSSSDSDESSDDEFYFEGKPNVPFPEKGHIDLDLAQALTGRWPTPVVSHANVPPAMASIASKTVPSMTPGIGVVQSYFDDDMDERVPDLVRTRKKRTPPSNRTSRRHVKTSERPIHKGPAKIPRPREAISAFKQTDLAPHVDAMKTKLEENNAPVVYTAAMAPAVENTTIKVLPEASAETKVEAIAEANVDYASEPKKAAPADNPKRTLVGEAKPELEVERKPKLESEARTQLDAERKPKLDAEAKLKLDAKHKTIVNDKALDVKRIFSKATRSSFTKRSLASLAGIAALRLLIGSLGLNLIGKHKKSKSKTATTGERYID